MIDNQDKIPIDDRNKVSWKTNFDEIEGHEIHSKGSLLKQGNDNGALTLMRKSNNKNSNSNSNSGSNTDRNHNTRTPSQRKQKQHSRNQEENQDKTKLIAGKNEEQSMSNKTMNNQRPPTSIKLRGKVNVKGHYCKEIEVLRKIKGSMEILKGHENQSMYLICQEIEVEKSLILEQKNGKIFDICFCKENNDNCMKKASKLSYNMIEKRISKYDKDSEKSPEKENLWNHSDLNIENRKMIVVVLFSIIFIY